eukprot:gene18088-23736_t
MPVVDGFKIPRIVALLSKLGADALQPKMVNGRYFGPLVSKRKAADLRKRAIIEGTFGTFSTVFGGWKPEWDEPKKIALIKPQKGHLRERTREARAAKITKAMKGMPDRVAKYRQEIIDKKPKKDLIYLFKNPKRS